MKWSWKLGKIAGIEVRLHVTFALLVGWILVSHWAAGHSLEAALAGAAFTLAVFACVLLHEFGHALAAARFGVATHDITLYPIGGAARLARIPEEPRQELWIALAGPAVNVGIAALLGVWLFLRNAWEPLDGLTVAGGSFAERLLVTNVILVLFNLLPAFPMDGGRVVRALLAARLPHARATVIAANVGQGMALVFAIAGLIWNPMLLVIAAFVWFGAAHEAETARLKSAVRGTPVHQAMMRDFFHLSPADTLGRASELLLDGSQTDFPVVHQGRVVGLLTRSDLIAGLARGGRDALVAHYMEPELHVVDVYESLETVVPRMAEAPHGVMAVVERGRLTGLLSRDNLNEFYLLETAIRESR